MTTEEVTTLVKSINHLWEVRITYGLVRTAWVPTFACQDAALVTEALQRHARLQATPSPPSPHELLAHCHALLDEQRQTAEHVARRKQAARAAEAWTRQNKTQRLPASVTTPGTVIRPAPSPLATDPYALAHVEMNDRHLNRPGHEAEAIAFCETKALEQPEERERWIREAQLYDRERLKRLVCPDQGARYVPDMAGASVIEELVGVREPGDENADFE
jgi:hypothetical protein